MAKTISITDSQIENTYQRVNWNAKAKDGTYPCRNKPCYSLDLVAQVLNTYARLFNDTKNQFHVREYTPNSVWKDDIAHKVALQTALLGGSTDKTKGKVKAILYEWYWFVNGKKQSNPNTGGGNSNGGTNTGIVPIVKSEDGVNYVDGLQDSESFMEKYGLLLGAGILGGVGIFMLTKNKKKGKKRR